MGNDAHVHLSYFALNDFKDEFSEPKEIMISLGFFGTKEDAIIGFEGLLEQGLPPAEDRKNYFIYWIDKPAMIKVGENSWEFNARFIIYDGSGKPWIPQDHLSITANSQSETLN